jgi:hypothetical protein
MSWKVPVGRLPKVVRLCFVLDEFLARVGAIEAGRHARGKGKSDHCAKRRMGGNRG